MTIPAKLILLRHGETQHNAERRITGLHDPELNAKGEAQADAAGAFLVDIYIDKTYSSHLKRAFNTASRALKASNAQNHLQNADGSWQIEQRPEIAEIDWGAFSGLSKDSVEIKSFPWNYDSVPPGGESQKQACARVKAFFETVVVPHLERGENVLLVAHSGVVNVFNIILGLVPVPPPGKPMLREAIENAMPSVFDFEDGVFVGEASVKKANNENNKNPAAPKKDGTGPKP